MTSPKTKYPIESFGPELMRALVEGGKRRLVIPFAGAGGGGKRLAHTFQRRIHTLRQRMREEKHKDYEIAMRAKVSLFVGNKAVEEGGPQEWKEDEQGKRGALIVIAPQDAEFEGVLSAVGIHFDKVTQPIAQEPKAESPPLDDSFLDELKPKETSK